MGRPAKTIKSVQKNLALPEDLVIRVDLELYSELEGKVPFGSWQELVVGLLEEHLQRVYDARGK